VGESDLARRGFRFVDDDRTGYPVKRRCELVEIPRSSFYERASRPLSEHYLDDVEGPRRGPPAADSVRAPRKVTTCASAS
jgi:hypothetical protein